MPFTLWMIIVALSLFATALHADERVRSDTIYGIHTRDRSGSSYIERDGVIYPTIKGTSAPDYGAQDRMIIRDGKVYEAIPGTTTPDYGTGRYLFQNEEREDD
jgi:hypothetical protein